MKNIVVSIFSEESKTYEAMSYLKSRTGTTDVNCASIIKNENGHITLQDGFGDDINDNWATGGLLGSLIGLLAGPLGMLLGGGLGMLIGGSVDASDADSTNSVIRQVIAKLSNYKLALVIVADEASSAELDAFLNSYGANEIIRASYTDVRAEVLHAQDVEKEMIKETKRRLREERREKRAAKSHSDHPAHEGHS
jgi:Protein of unknown function (DUF1269).